MDSPLTTAELSRLRKAIQQRDRLVAQGLVTSAVDSRISSALSNLKLYLPAHTQLAVILRDWETSDSAKRSHITIWLQQNILNDDSSQVGALSPIVPSSTAFAHPPPPPPLPSRAASLISRSGRPSSSGTPPPLSRSTPVQAPSDTTNAYPPREIHTQASFKPPTPPPKDRVLLSAQESLARRHSLAGHPQNAHRSNNFVDNPTIERNVDSPAGCSLYPNAFAGRNATSSQPGAASLNSNNTTQSSRRFGTQTGQSTPPSYSHTPDLSRPGLPRYDSDQHHMPPSSGQPASTPQPLPGLAKGYTQQQNFFAQGMQGGTTSVTDSPYNQQLVVMLANIQAQQAQQSSALLQQLSQAQQSSTSNTTAQILAAAQQQQAQHQANFLQQLQAQQAASTNNTTQLLANIQQQQQAQSSQMASMLQQYQQNAANFNPYQNVQQNQQMLDLLSQMQSGGAPGIDWASLASGSGIDPNTLMTMMMSVMDPTNIAVQGAGFMFG